MSHCSIEHSLCKFCCKVGEDNYTVLLSFHHDWLKNRLSIPTLYSQTQSSSKSLFRSLNEWRSHPARCVPLRWKEVTSNKSWLLIDRSKSICSYGIIAVSCKKCQQVAGDRHKLSDLWLLLIGWLTSPNSLSSKTGLWDSHSRFSHCIDPALLKNKETWKQLCRFIIQNLPL